MLWFGGLSDWVCRASFLQKEAAMWWLLVIAALLFSTTQGSAKITEWPITLRNKVQPSLVSIGLKEAEVVPIVDPPFHCAGYLELNNTFDAELFYFYFQDRNKDPNAPLLLWTNGGPGGSSLFGLFMENGPYVIQEDLTLRWNEFGWDQGQNLLYVDQPVGTGFSRTGDERDYAHYEDTVGEDMLVFFLEFMALHPELQGKDLYLSGESYAGHYLPAIADAIYESNKKGEFMHLNLKGLLMGSPWTSPLTAFLSAPTFAEFHGLISKETADEIRSHNRTCTEYSVECNETKSFTMCTDALQYCRGNLEGPIQDAVPGLNPGNIGEKCIQPPLCCNTTLLVDFLNSPSIQAELKVNKTWVPRNFTIMNMLAGDIMLDMVATVVNLLNADLRILIYVGDQDLGGNWMGNKVWIDSMMWKKRNQWMGTFSSWEVDTKYKGREAAGECESVEPLTFCKVYQAGHMAPMDQPEHTYRMVRTFISGDRFVAAEPTSILTNVGKASGIVV